MSSVKKGQLTASLEWRKHLRDTKRVFWKRERKAAKRLLDDKLHDAVSSVPSREPRVR
jgi:hypothetical protein